MFSSFFPRRVKEREKKKILSYIVNKLNVTWHDVTFKMISNFVILVKRSGIFLWQVKSIKTVRAAAIKFSISVFFITKKVPHLILPGNRYTSGIELAVKCIIRRVQIDTLYCRELLNVQNILSVNCMWLE